MNRNLVWCLSGNFGDEIGPYLFEKITGKRPVYAQPGAAYEHVISAGSILNWATCASQVWGAGLASWKDEVPACVIRAVRGPLSRLRARSCGVMCSDVYGDPALLLTLFCSAKDETRHYEVGILPHYVDIFRAYEWFGSASHVRIIDPLQPVEKVISQIRSCDVLFSSSLHGLIVADAYGVPNAWVRMSSSIGGDGMKYWDYLASVGRARVDEPPKPINWESGERTLDAKLCASGAEQAAKLAERIWNVCPWRAVA